LFSPVVFRTVFCDIPPMVGCPLTARVAAAVASLLAVGCTVEFDPNRTFPCQNDDDCVAGHVCRLREGQRICMRYVALCVGNVCDATVGDALPVVGDGGLSPIDSGPGKDARPQADAVESKDAARPPRDAVPRRDVPVTAPDAEPPRQDATPPARNCPPAIPGDLALDCPSREGLCVYEFNAVPARHRFDCRYVCGIFELECRSTWDDDPDWYCRPTSPLHCDTRGWTLVCGCVPPPE